MLDPCLKKVEEYKKGLLSYLGQYGKCDIEITNIIEGQIINKIKRQPTPTLPLSHPQVSSQLTYFETGQRERWQGRGRLTQAGNVQTFY